MRSWRLFSLLLLVPFLFCISCSDNDKATNTGTDEGVLKGRVVDSSGEGGLAGATVRIEGTDMVAVTDEDGSFEFPGMAGGDFTVVIEPPTGAPYQSNRVGVSVHEGETVTVDLTVLPDSASVGEIEMFPASARVGLLESVQFFIGWPGAWDGEGNGSEGDGAESISFPYRPTWTIVSDHPIGVISREGIFIGTATGSGQVIATFSETLRAMADIEVVADNEVARIVVRPGYWVHVPAGESRYLAAYAINGAGELATGVPFVWGVDPQALGTIEAVTTLTPEEVRAIFESLTWGDGWGPAGGTEPGGADGSNSDDHGPKEFAIGVAGDSSDPSGGGDEPVPGPDPWEIDPAAIQIVRFTAAADVSDRAEGRITVKVDGADWGETIGLTVVERGELTSAWLYPEDVTVLPESDTTFIAYGMNEWDQVLGGLVFEWSVVPASLGSIEAAELPWMEPGGNGERGGPDDSGGPGFGWGSEGDSVEPPMPPMPPDDRPFPGWEGAALFRASSIGEGEVVVVVRDTVANVTIERRAIVRVAEAATLASIELRPDPIDAYIGDSTFVEALARNTWGDIEWSALVRIEFEGDAGTFVPYDGPRIAEYDSIPPHGDPGEPPASPTDPDDPPEPGSGYGVAFGVFFANNPGGTGVMRATAIGPDGASFVVEAPVRAIAEIGKR